MQEGVPAHVDYVRPGRSMKKHVHELGVSVHTGIVERRKAMLITALYINDIKDEVSYYVYHQTHNTMMTIVITS
jgi:hypothetical protein